VTYLPSAVASESGTAVARLGRPVIFDSQTATPLAVDACWRPWPPGKQLQSVPMFLNLRQHRSGSSCLSDTPPPQMFRRRHSPRAGILPRRCGALYRTPCMRSPSAAVPRAWCKACAWLSDARSASSILVFLDCHHKRACHSAQWYLRRLNLHTALVSIACQGIIGYGTCCQVPKCARRRPLV